MGLGGKPTPFFFSQQNLRKSIFSLRVVNDNEIVRNTSDGVEGISHLIWCAIFEAVGAEVFCNFWLPLNG